MLKNFEVLWIRAYIALVCALIAAEVKAQNLPLPPDIGGTSAQANDPLGYMVGAIRTLVLLGFLVVAVVGMMTYGGGMVAELNNARTRGRMGPVRRVYDRRPFRDRGDYFCRLVGCKLSRQRLVNCGDWHLKRSNAKSCDTTRP